MNNLTNVHFIEVKPCKIIPIFIGYTFPISYTCINVEVMHIRNDNGIACIRKFLFLLSPPLNNIIIFQFQFIFTSNPIDKLLLAVDLFKNFVLLASVLELYHLLLNIFFFHKFCFICQTNQLDLVSSQMNIWVRKYVKYLSKNLSDELICFMQCHIQWTYIATTLHTSNVLVLWSLTPTSCMPWSV